VNAWTHQVSRAVARIRNAMAVGTVRLVDDSGAAQRMQVEISAIEMLNNQEVCYHWGFSSCPPVGTQVVMMFTGGDRNRGIVMGSNDPGTRTKGLKPGEWALDDGAGNHIHLKQGGTLEITAATALNIITPTLAVTGAITATGDITAGQGTSDQVAMRELRVSGVQSGSSSSGEPVPGS
jgi:phage baseplate assembly protein V